MKCHIRFKNDGKYRSLTIYKVKSIEEALPIFKRRADKRFGFKNPDIYSARLYKDKYEFFRIGNFGDLSKYRLV